VRPALDRGDAGKEGEAQAQKDARDIAELAVEIGRDRGRMAQPGPLTTLIPPIDSGTRQAIATTACSATLGDQSRISLRTWIARSEMRTSTMKAIRHSVSRLTDR
jgi:hypothetical protein